MKQFVDYDDCNEYYYCPKAVSKIYCLKCVCLSYSYSENESVGDSRQFTNCDDENENNDFLGELAGYFADKYTKHSVLNWLTTPNTKSLNFDFFFFFFYWKPKEILKYTSNTFFS